MILNTYKMELQMNPEINTYLQLDKYIKILLLIFGNDQISEISVKLEYPCAN